MIAGLIAGIFILPAYYVAKSKGYNLGPTLVVTAVLAMVGIPILIDIIDHPDVVITHPLPVWSMMLPVLAWCIISLLPTRKDAPGEDYLEITFECPVCEEEVTFPRAKEGQVELCPECGEIITIPMDEFSPETSIPERIKPDISSGPVCYANFGEEMRALQMQALFEDNGIKAEIIAETAGGTLPQLGGTHGFRLSIDIEDWDKAVAIEKSIHRRYLYIFNDPEAKFIVASGIEFKVLVKQLADRGLFLLGHGYPYASFDAQSGFGYIPSTEIKELAKEHIYAWGGFCWVDFTGNPPFALGKNTISELLYFAHTAEPLNTSIFDELQNRFLCYMFADGWYLKLYYRDWSDVEGLLQDVIPGLGESPTIIRDIEIGDGSFWIANGVSERCDKTMDINSILSEKLK